MEPKKNLAADILSVLLTPLITVFAFMAITILKILMLPMIVFDALTGRD